MHYRRRKPCVIVAMKLLPLSSVCSEAYSANLEGCTMCVVLQERELHMQEALNQAMIK